ncbi:unnamed protein product, partial [Ectocarpus sp. 12 AP-2014]
MPGSADEALDGRRQHQGPKPVRYRMASDRRGCAGGEQCLHPDRYGDGETSTVGGTKRDGGRGRLGTTIPRQRSGRCFDSRFRLVCRGVRRARPRSLPVRRGGGPVEADGEGAEEGLGSARNGGGARPRTHPRVPSECQLQQ